MTCHLNEHQEADMSRQEQQRIRNAIWQTRWQKCEELGVTMAEYARRDGFDAQTAYRWRRLRRLAGRGLVAKASEPGKGLTIRKPAASTVFARVAVREAAVEHRSLLLRVMLINGRRAELELASIAQLGEAIAVLERTA
jgi:hypothetical protein